MTRKKRIVSCVVLALLILSVVVTVLAESSAQETQAQGEAQAQAALGTATSTELSTGFTYQGQLKRAGVPTSDTCNMAFRLYDQATAGNQVGSAITASVPMSDGLFTARLDFGSAAFTGDGRWLGVRVNCPGDSAYADLGRHELTAAPYALYADQAPWSGLTDMPASFADGSDDDTLSGLSCANGQVPEWNGSAWVCGDDNAGSGDIDAVYAGEGLSGGGQSGSVTITLDLPVPTATLALSANQAPWPGLTGMPAGFADGVDDVAAVVSGTSIFAGDGLTQISGTNSVTMAVYFAGSGGDYGAATSVARSDHAHDSRYYAESELNTSGGGGQVHWDNLSNVPAGFVDGIDDVGLMVETDPVFGASAANGISSGDVISWNTAYGWGNHSAQGYLTSYTETDPVWTAASANYYTQGNMQTSGQSQLHWDNLTNVPTDLADGDDDTIYTVGTGLTMTGTEISVDLIAVAPSTHTHVYFQQEALFPTNGAHDWEFFTIGSDSYLAVANYYNGSTGDIDSKIYRWDGTSFVEFQSISTTAAVDWEFFTIGADAYLAVAHLNPSGNSKIYQWSGTSFVEFQSIPTDRAIAWEFFTIGSDVYLAVANMADAGYNYNINSKIYKWNGTNFAEFQSIPTNGATDWEFFTIGSDSYLAVANHRNNSTHNIDSKIYRWNGTNFAEFQSVPTNQANDWEFFTIGSDSYLAVANAYNDSTPNINSKIYRWNETNFTEFQSIPTNGAYDWEFFTIGSDSYLAVANGSNGSTKNIDSKIYRWNETNFAEFQSISTNDVREWKFFTIGSDFYLAVANSHNDSTYNVDSKIYKLQSCCGTSLWGKNSPDTYYEPGNVGIGTTVPQSALQVEGYVQLDTLTAAPPAADCDEASERGRMMVDIVNDLLYICTNSGWISK